MSSHVISQQGQRKSFDVLVIGSGIAGLSYCLELLEHAPETRIALITKKSLSDSNTFFAQGGIAAANLPVDSVEQHVVDTLVAGDGACDEAAVKAILAEGPQSIQFLIEQGVLFDKDAEQQLSCAQEAGHSTRRVFHHGDKTGAAIATALIQKVKQAPQITILENHIVVNLITQNIHSATESLEVVGAYILDEVSSLIHVVMANVIVLATGGAGKVYRYTTNPETATGDGVAMAYRAGARVGAMEFYQFHPTLLYHRQLNNFLISEALRGEGAYLRLPETGERFMARYEPTKMELATRDIVSRAVFTEMERGGYDYVHLDIRHKEKIFLAKRFPTIFQTLLKLGFDLSQDLIPVVPAAHYLCGGVLSDVNGRTDLHRLYAVGETAYTGLHGANRLASNSLLEGLVTGRKAALACLKDLHSTVVSKQMISDWDSTSVVDWRRASQIKVHWRGLRGEMTSYAGIVRTEAGLTDQLKLIQVRREMIEEYYWKYAITRDLIELRNIGLVAELIVRSALAREESRGGHFREDFPEHDKQVKKALYLKKD